MPLTSEDHDLLGKMPEKPVLCVINNPTSRSASAQRTQRLLPETAPVPSSSPRNMATVSNASPKDPRNDHRRPPEEASEAIIADLRQRVALDSAAECLSRVKEGLSPELAALEIREALSALGEITGRTTSDEVLDRIFANFCIGK